MPTPNNAEIARRLVSLYDLLQDHPHGASAPELLAAHEARWGERLERRTLLRRLRHLLAEGRVRVEGPARALRYHPVPVSLDGGRGQRPAPARHERAAHPATVPRPPSRDGEEIREIVREMVRSLR